MHTMQHDSPWTLMPKISAKVRTGSPLGWLVGV